MSPERGDDITDHLPSSGAGRSDSAHLESAAQRQIERDRLDDLVSAFEEAHGPAAPEAVAAKRARLTGEGFGTGALP
ncbi:hypothetical protein JL475_34860 [Streptomyces sp. M2CJ-2]|nr:hypothetical protein [Streptomyces sp. M2CJ-2]